MTEQKPEPKNSHETQAALAAAKAEAEAKRQWAIESQPKEIVVFPETTDG